MLTDQELLNLASPREPVESDNNVFEDGCCTVTSPVSPPRPTPGIILTVEGSSPEIIDVADHSRQRSTRRSSRRNRQTSSSQHRSPSGSRMSSSTRQQQPQQNGHRLRDPAHLSGSGVSRSQSMRTARRPQSVDPTHRFRHRIASIPNDMTLPSDGFNGQRLASNQSLPLPDDEDVMRLRNFAITSKGIVNRGDSFRSKSRSSHSVASMGGGSGGQMPLTPSRQLKDDSNVDYYASACAAQQEIAADVEKIAVEGAARDVVPKCCNRYRVLLLGPPDVGKTALINQFMTSEYMCAYENSQDEENEKSVPVILNGSESELVFSEHQFTGDSNLNFCELFNADAYLVVYSVTSKRSLQTAKEAMKAIHKWDDIHRKALILVGNKTDLARHRVLSTDDGRSVASEEGSKFIETSAGINHQVDELLVGILSQIRLKLSSMEKALQKRESVSLKSTSSGGKLRGGKCSGCAGCKAKGILKRILKKACPRSKSCDNLHVL